MKSSLKTLQIKARQQVYTYLSGNHFSKLLGEGYDFSTLSEYQMGDDIKKIDWTVSAKLQKPYIKHFDSHRELSIVIATLMDASLYFGTGNDKQETLIEVASILAYATVQDANQFTGISYTQTKIYATQPSKQIYHINHFSKILYESSLLRTTLDYKASIKNLFARIHTPSLIFVIGDFLEKIDLSLLAQKHEIIAIIIRDRDEESNDALGEVVLHNPYNQKTIDRNMSKKDMLKYTSKLKDHDRDTRTHFNTYRIKFIKIFTDEDAIKKLSTLFV